MGPGLTGSALTSRIDLRDTRVKGGGAMAPIILNAGLRGELEDLVLRTPSAKERCRAQAVPGSPRDSLLSRSPRRSRSAVRPFTTGPTAFSAATALTSGRACSTPRGQGRPPAIAEVIDPLIAAALARDPRQSGYHATVWTAELLQQDLEQAHGIRASLKSISVAIARLHSRWKRPRHELAAGPETWRQVKGG